MLSHLVCSSRSACPPPCQTVLSATLGPLAHPSRSTWTPLPPHCSQKRLRRPNLTFGKLSCLGNFKFGKLLLRKLSFGKSLLGKRFWKNTTKFLILRSCWIYIFYYYLDGFVLGFPIGISLRGIMRNDSFRLCHFML